MHPIDKLVGTKIRLYRNLKGFSQEELAGKLGVTFQQVQKYEKGVNRVSASRLYEMACILEQPISDFFYTPSGKEGKLIEDCLQDTHLCEALILFSKIKSKDLRLNIIRLLKHLK